FPPRDDGEEVVARELPQFAGEAACAVGEEDLRLAVAAGVEKNLARRGMAGVILIADVELEVAERNPAGLAAPARMDDFLVIGEQSAKRGAGLGRVLLFEARVKGEWANRNVQHAHGYSAPDSLRGSRAAICSASAASTRSGVIGCWLIHTPVASWIAMAA